MSTGQRTKARELREPGKQLIGIAGSGHGRGRGRQRQAGAGPDGLTSMGLCLGTREPQKGVKQGCAPERSF